MDNIRKFKAHPQSAPGDFYVVNDECLSCRAPHAVSPDLIGWAEGGEYQHCIWKKQPETPEEMEQAFNAFDASEIGCYRYAGSDETVMKRIGLDYCDQAFRGRSPVERTVRDDAVEIRFSLTASKGTLIGVRLKDAFARLASLLKWS